MTCSKPRAKQSLATTNMQWMICRNEIVKYKWSSKCRCYCVLQHLKRCGNEVAAKLTVDITGTIITLQAFCKVVGQIVEDFASEEGLLTAHPFALTYRIAGNFRGVQFSQFSRLIGKPRKLNPRNKNLYASSRARLRGGTAIVICMLLDRSPGQLLVAPWPYRRRREIHSVSACKIRLIPLEEE